MLTRGVLINVAGLGATLLGIQTMVGMLVAKTLTNASVNPFIASTASGYNPVLALDVFLVQVGGGGRALAVPRMRDGACVRAGLRVASPRLNPKP